MPTEQENLYVEFDNNLYRIGGISALIPQPAKEVISGLGDLGSGSYSGNMEVAGGYIQSFNFKTGVSGWQLTPVSGEINFAVSFGGIPVGGAAADVNANATTIDGGKITTGSIETTQLDADAINGMTITGALIQTSTSGSRVVLDGTNDHLSIYDSGNDLRIRLDNDELTFYDTNGNERGGIYASATTTLYFHAIDGGNIIIETEGALYGTLIYANGSQVAAFTTAGLGMDDNITMNNNDIVSCGNIEANDTTSDIGTSSVPFDNLWIDEVNGAAGSIDFNETGRIQVSTHFDPSDGGSSNLGGATRYWGDISYKTLTDRGCIGWYDEGVELRDGTKVSDTEALMSIKKHPTNKTPAGAARIDYESLPKHVYVKAKDHDGTELPRDEFDRPYFDEIDKKDGKIKRHYAQDGAETTALLSIMLGAIKELTVKYNALEKQLKQV